MMFIPNICERVVEWVGYQYKERYNKTNVHFPKPFSFSTCLLGLATSISVILALKSSFFTKKFLLLGSLSVYLSLNTRNCFLFYAASQGKIKTLNTALFLGADLNQKTFEGWTPLHYAIFHSQDIAIKILFQHNKLKIKDFDSLDKCFETAALMQSLKTISLENNKFNLSEKNILDFVNLHKLNQVSLKSFDTQFKEVFDRFANKIERASTTFRKEKLSINLEFNDKIISLKNKWTQFLLLLEDFFKMKNDINDANLKIDHLPTCQNIKIRNWFKEIDEVINFISNFENEIKNIDTDIKDIFNLKIKEIKNKLHQFVYNDLSSFLKIVEKSLNSEKIDKSVLDHYFQDYFKLYRHSSHLTENEIYKIILEHTQEIGHILIIKSQKFIEEQQETINELQKKITELAKSKNNPEVSNNNTLYRILDILSKYDLEKNNETTLLLLKIFIEYLLPTDQRAAFYSSSQSEARKEKYLKINQLTFQLKITQLGNDPVLFAQDLLNLINEKKNNIQQHKESLGKQNFSTEELIEELNSQKNSLTNLNFSHHPFNKEQLNDTLKRVYPFCESLLQNKKSMSNALKNLKQKIFNNKEQDQKELNNPILNNALHFLALLQELQKRYNNEAKYKQYEQDEQALNDSTTVVKIFQEQQKLNQENMKKNTAHGEYENSIKKISEQISAITQWVIQLNDRLLKN